MFVHKQFYHPPEEILQHRIVQRKILMLTKWIERYIKKNDGYKESNGSLTQLRVLTNHLSNGSGVPFKNSEYFLKALFDCIKEAVFILNENGEIVYANSSCENILGWTPEEITEFNIQTIIPSFISPSSDENFPYIVLYHVVSKDMTITEREVIISCFQNGQKGLVLTMEDNSDNTDRIDTDLSLWKQHFRAIMESSKDCIFAWDTYMRFIYANKSTREYFLIDESKIQRKPVEEVMQGVKGFYEIWEKRSQECAKTGKAQNYLDTFEIDGKTTFGSSSIGPILNSNGEIEAFSISYRDETGKVLRQKREDEIVNVYKSISHLLDEVVFICSNDGTVIFANSKVAEKFNKEDSDQMKGVRFLSLIAQEDRERVEEIISEVTSSVNHPPVLTKGRLVCSDEKCEYEMLIASVMFAGQMSFVTVMRNVEIVEGVKEFTCPFRMRCSEVREEFCQLADKLKRIHKATEA